MKDWEKRNDYEREEDEEEEEEERERERRLKKNRELEDVECAMETERVEKPKIDWVGEKWHRKKDEQTHIYIYIYI